MNGENFVCNPSRSENRVAVPNGGKSFEWLFSFFFLLDLGDLVLHACCRGHMHLPAKQATDPIRWCLVWQRHRWGSIAMTLANGESGLR